MLGKRFDWKINFRTYAKSKAEGASVNKKFESYEADVEDKMPRLTMVLCLFVASQGFQNSLYKLLKEKEGTFHLD